MRWIPPSRVMLPSSALRAVDAVILNHGFVIDIKLGPIVGGKQEAVLAGIVDIEIAAVIDGEPLEAVGDAREAFLKIAGWNVEGAGVNGAGGFQFLELGEPVRIGTEQVDIAAEAKRIDHGDAEGRDRRVTNGGDLRPGDGECQAGSSGQGIPGGHMSMIEAIDVEAAGRSVPACVRQLSQQDDDQVPTDDGGKPVIQEDHHARPFELHGHGHQQDGNDLGDQ